MDIQWDLISHSIAITFFEQTNDVWLDGSDSVNNCNSISEIIGFGKIK